MYRVVSILLLAACSSVPIAPVETTTPSSTSPTLSDVLDTGDLIEPVVTTVRVDGHTLVVAVAATPEERSQGLRAVDDLGDLDGMLFWWGGDTVTSRFTMADTIIPLDIAFFSTNGSYVDGFPMTPCSVADCPAYSAETGYVFALEVPAGSQPQIGSGSVLEFSR